MWNGGRPISTTNDARHASRCQDLKPPLLSLPHKQVTREKGNRNFLDAILPSTTRLIDRKKNLEILILQDSSRNFFVLVASVYRVPIVVASLSNHRIPPKVICSLSVIFYLCPASDCKVGIASPF